MSSAPSFVRAVLHEHLIWVYRLGMIPLSHDEIKSMSVADRMELLGEIWNTFETTEVPLTTAQTEELDRRLDTFDEDIKRAIPMEQVFDKLKVRKP